LSLDFLNETVSFLGFMLVWNSLCIGFFLFGGFIFLFSILLHKVHDAKIGHEFYITI
jgi:hypothetical protein